MCVEEESEFHISLAMQVKSGHKDVSFLGVHRLLGFVLPQRAYPNLIRFLRVRESHSDIWVMTPYMLPGGRGWEEVVKNLFLVHSNNESCWCLAKGNI